MKLCICLLAIIALAIETQGQDIRRDVPYADPAEKRQVLDIYAPSQARNLPVVFWIHGGGWHSGDKANIHIKPKAFMDKGFVFVSTNYRMLWDVEMETIIRDIAKSIRWVHDHIADYGGDPNRIFVMGHSAGAQLAALVCTDDRYLKAEGVSLKVIAGCVPVDGDTYDIPAMVETAETRNHAHGLPDDGKYSHRAKFGPDASRIRNFSAVTFVAKDKGIPPFLILYVAEHPDTTAQAKRFKHVLEAAGIPVSAFSTKETTHVKLDVDLGQPDDPATIELWKFLNGVLKK